MNLTAFRCWPGSAFYKAMRNTRYIAMLLSAGLCLSLASSVKAQGITIALTNASLEEALNQIKKQSDYNFIYTRIQMGAAKPVTIQVQGQSLGTVLYLCFKDQPLTYVIEDKQIVVREKKIETRLAVPIVNDVAGRVTDENGNPIVGATVTLKRTGQARPTNEAGSYFIKDLQANDVLVFTSVGYESEEALINGKVEVNVHMRVAVANLDQTIIIAYGSTTKRLSTGNVEKITAQEIAKQPVSNPLAALQGRIAGLSITQGSGIAGSGFTVRIRGQNSIIQGSEPLFILDGVPFASGNTAINQISNAAGGIGLSPFNLLNPSDIESIEVLKDADATAIYGSRGANGVILITTKRGKPGASKMTLNLYHGWSNVTRTMSMLNTPQYIQMRKEAFSNDGVISNGTNAPDLTLWDTTKYTDLKKLLIGGTARTFDAQLSFSGGNATTQFLIGTGFHKETTVFPTDLGDQKASVHFNINHSSGNQKFNLTLSGNYISDKNRMHFGDPTRYIILPPHIQLYDSVGKINWVQNGVAFSSIGFGENSNPLANLKTLYTGRFNNLLSNLQLGYKLFSSLTLRLNLGYNTLLSEESELKPSTALDPTLGMLPFAYFGTSSLKSWIIEPQLQYYKKLKDGKLEVLFGATAQERQASSLSANAMDYSSDLFLSSIAGAGTVTTSNGYSQYRYNAFFGRINYNFKDEYLVNLSGRRDGSSRFGPRSRFSNFGAIGTAWVFTKHKLFAKKPSILSFGKIRLSYGITGNDQIGDYRYLDSWTASSQGYRGLSSLNPTTLYNPDYEWELNKKLEAAIDLGFLKDRLLFSIAFFRNHSGNQIVQYTLPTQTGFSSVGKNLDASIRNWGWEITAQSKNIVGKFLWTSSVNISFLKNKLVDFPGLATSSYSNTYTIGEALSARKVYKFLGLDSAGVYSFNDINRDGKLDRTDRVVLANPAPLFYGGFQNSFSSANFELSIFLEFKNQTGFNYLRDLNAQPPGTMRNQPIIALDRWQKPGDQTSIQKFTTTSGRPAYVASLSNIGISEAIYSDASFVRLKNISMSYHFSQKLLAPLHMNEGRVYLQAQNLLTITGYKGADPENQNLFTLPPLRTLAVRVQFSF